MINIEQTERLLRPSQIEKIIPGKTARVLATERCLRRDTPPFIRIGKRIYYRESDLLAWIEQHKVDPTKQELRSVAAAEVCHK
jgi:predicted DNA-binding transcriptional regulator AlpA